MKKLIDIVMEIKTVLTKTLWYLSIALLSVFVCKQWYSESAIYPLKGAIEKVEFPTWNSEDWLSGSFQEAFDKASNRNFGFHSIFILLHNQWDYHCWKRANSKDVIIGKDDYLFEQPYIDGLYGVKHAEKISTLESKKQSILNVCNAFKSRGKEVLFAIMPGKHLFHSDKIPDRLRGEIAEENIYTVFKKWVQENELNYIDFQKYFVEHKQEIKHPIFTKLGIHLSDYAENIVLDSLLHYIENKSDENIYDYQFSETSFSTKPWGRDADIGNALNLWKPLQSETLTYRSIEFSAVDQQFTPRVLIIGDSFYWKLFHIANENKLFSKHEFWYRNHSVWVPNQGKEKHFTSDVRTLQSLDDFDIVLIMGTSITIEEYGWGYFERLDQLIAK